MLAINVHDTYQKNVQMSQKCIYTKLDHVHFIFTIPKWHGPKSSIVYYTLVKDWNSLLHSLKLIQNNNKIKNEVKTCFAITKWKDSWKWLCLLLEFWFCDRSTWIFALIIVYAVGCLVKSC